MREAIGILLVATLLLGGCQESREASENGGPTASGPAIPSVDALSLHYLPGRHRITLWHCGIEPTSFAGGRWYVPEPPFDETNVGPFLDGEMKLIGLKRAKFTSDDGLREVVFVPLRGKWNPPGGCA